MSDLNTSVPTRKILRIFAKAIRRGRGGYTRDELRELAADLLDLGAILLELSEAPDAS
jgi:hypothetical protein